MVEAIVASNRRGANDIRKLFAGSYGCMTTVLCFITGLDRLKLQQLSTWWYHNGVARLQTRFTLMTLPLNDKVFFLKGQNMVQYDTECNTFISCQIGSNLKLESRDQNFNF